MRLSRSLWRKAVFTLTVVAGILSIWQATTVDSQRAAQQLAAREEVAEPAPGAHLLFWATAYCKGEVTKSGLPPRSGIAAADPDLLPVGSVIQVGTSGEKYAGIYTIMDTGPMVKGRELDIYMWSCTEALTFGRQRVHVVVLRLGWHPNASAPNLIEVLLAGGGNKAGGELKHVLPSRRIQLQGTVTLPALPIQSDRHN